MTYLPDFFDFTYKIPEQLSPVSALHVRQSVSNDQRQVDRLLDNKG